MTMKRRLITGNTHEYPFNTHFTPQEIEVLRAISDLKERVTGLKARLRTLTHHACVPPEKYRPDQMEEFETLTGALTSLEEQLRWIPGGAYRFAADESSEAAGSLGNTSPIPRRRTHG